MGYKMKDLDQQIINFNYDKSLEYDDFYISKSNNYILNFLNNWPKWEKNFLNINGERFSGKTHLINIFQKKFGALIIESSQLSNKNLSQIKFYQNIILENLENEVNEELLFTLINFIDQDNKYLLVTTKVPIVDIKFNLPDLNSRTKNFLIQSIAKPDDDLIFALILKNLSDRQISLSKK